MDLDEQFALGHLLFSDRKCRSCGKVKSLLEDFYLIRKNKKPLSSAYSYECKICTIKRIQESKKSKRYSTDWCYPDW